MKTDMNHRYAHRLGILLISLLSSACSPLNGLQSDAPDYAGSGGMTAYNITPSAYLYHYQFGFSGEDALGWDPTLQTVWSRIGAAVTCKVPFDKPLLIRQLSAYFGHSSAIHELDGIGFHAVQSRKVAGFCSEQRRKSLAAQIEAYQQGKFPR